MNTKLLTVSLLAIVLISQGIKAQSPTAAADEADQLFKAQQWEAAARAYDALTKSDPAKGPFWYRLGFSLNSVGKYEEATVALQRAVDIGHHPQAMYALAHSYVYLKDRDLAFEWLTKAVENNLPQPRQISRDQSLAVLKGDARYQQLLSLIEKKARVCMNIAEYRQFDFWVGDWDVFNPAGQKVGTNRVVPLQDGCIIEENWASAAGGTGQSFNFYNPVTHKWHQSYMDNGGGNWMMDGEYKDGALRYEGAIFTPTGKTLVKMTFTNLGADKVRQTAETSSDEGRTWAPIWNGLYVRKK